jgi:DNA-binding NarL/FixJ family response regulator
MKSKNRVMIVEDHPGYRQVITRALKGQPDMELISQFGTVEIALRGLDSVSKSETPDLVLLDLNLPGMSGLDAIPWFKKYLPNIKIIILTQSNRESDILSAISLGAEGYLLKSSTIAQVREAIRVVMAGGSSLDPEVARFILNTFETKTPVATSKVELTERELDILTMIGDGLVKKEIGDRLDISTDTVSYHVKHIYSKLNVPNAPAAVNKAHKQGLFKK